MANKTNANLREPKKRMSYASLIISLSSIILMLITGLIVVMTEPYGSFGFYLKNIYLFFGYMVFAQMFNARRIILMALYIIFTLLPLAGAIVALIGSRKRKKLWIFPVSLAVALLLFGFYVYSIISLIPG